MGGEHPLEKPEGFPEELNSSYSIIENFWSRSKPAS